MAIFKLYKSTIPSLNYYFKDGKQAPFIGGRYTTNNETEIEELNKEVAANNPYIYVDKTESEIDSDALSPIEQIRKEAYEKAKADLLASGQLSEVDSISEQGKTSNSFATSENLKNFFTPVNTNTSSTILVPDVKAEETKVPVVEVNSKLASLVSTFNNK